MGCDLMYGLNLMPYSYMIVSAILSQLVFCSAVLLYGFMFKRNEKKPCHDVDIILLGVRFCAAICSSLLIVFLIDEELLVGKSSWQQYQIICGALLNSYPGSFLAGWFGQLYILALATAICKTKGVFIEGTEDIVDDSSHEFETTAIVNDNVGLELSDLSAGSSNNVPVIKGYSCESLTTDSLETLDHFIRATNRAKYLHLEALIFENSDNELLVSNIDISTMSEEDRIKIEMEMYISFQKDQDIIEYAFFAVFLIFGAPLYTHCIVGFVLYCWYLLTFIIAGLILKALTNLCIFWEEDYVCGSYYYHLTSMYKLALLRALYQLFFMILFQTCFNITFLYYENGMYLGSIVDEIQHRDSACFYNNMFSSGAGAMQALNWI